MSCENPRNFIFLSEYMHISFWTLLAGRPCFWLLHTAKQILFFVITHMRVIETCGFHIRPLLWLAAINGFNKALKVDGIKKKGKLSGKVARLAARPPKLLHAKKKNTSTWATQVRRWPVINMEFLHSFLRQHFAGKLLVVWQNVGCFFRLKCKCCACV